MKNNRMPAPSSRTRVRTSAKRGTYDQNTIYDILDNTFVCHVGFIAGGCPFVIPVVYGREKNKIYFHGGKGSRMQKTVKEGIDICITVTILDGLVLARSAFHHSVNYRSVVVFGRAEEVQKPEDKTGALKIIMDHLLPVRWDDVRKPNDKELNATSVLSLDLNEASAKIRSGPEADEEEDLNLPVWAGIIPLKIVPSNPIPSKNLSDNIMLPDYINDYLASSDK